MRVAYLPCLVLAQIEHIPLMAHRGVPETIMFSHRFLRVGTVTSWSSAISPYGVQEAGVVCRRYSGGSGQINYVERRIVKEQIQLVLTFVSTKETKKQRGLWSSWFDGG